MASLSENLFGTQDTFKQLPTLNNQQLGTQSQLGQNISPLLQSLMSNNGGLSPIMQQARSRFQSQTVPSLAERFTSLGGQGGQRSSAFQGALGNAGAGLEENLSAMQQGQNNNLLSLLLGYSQQPSFENIFMPGRQGAFGGLASGFGEGLGRALPHALLAGLTGGASLPLSGLSGLSSMFGGGGGGNQNQQQMPYALSGGFGNPYGGNNFAQQFGMRRF